MNNNEFWSSELPPGYYDEILDSGLKKRRGFRANWHNITFSYISNYVNDNFNHLDYACGPGTLIGQFTNGNSIGVDLSSKQINYANQTYKSKGNFKTLENYSFEKNVNHFDIVTILGLFEYLNDDDILESCFPYSHKGARKKPDLHLKLNDNLSFTKL